MLLKHSQTILKSLQKLSVKPITSIPVIAIDGPSASGKGSVAERVAKQLGFHYLDSGALYRIVALAAQKNNIEWCDAKALEKLTKILHITFDNGEVFLNKENVSDEIRNPAMSIGASKVAVHPEVRNTLLNLQNSFKQAPGLVADGRDMASVVFKDACLKIFLTADVETRAQRRYKQLLDKQQTADYQQLLTDLQERDHRDSQRSAGPLIQTKDAVYLDTTDKDINEAVVFVLSVYKKA